MKLWVVLSAGNSGTDLKSHSTCPEHHVIQMRGQGELQHVGMVDIETIDIEEVTFGVFSN